MEKFRVEVEDVDGTMWCVELMRPGQARAEGLEMGSKGAVSKGEDGSFTIIPPHRIKTIRFEPEI